MTLGQDGTGDGVLPRREGGERRVFSLGAPGYPPASEGMSLSTPGGSNDPYLSASPTKHVDTCYNKQMTAAHELNAGDVVIHESSMKTVHSTRTTRLMNQGAIVVTWSDASTSCIPANAPVTVLYQPNQAEQSTT